MTLSISNLTKSFGNKVAVNNISFELPKGEVLGLLGRNGAGKSTTIKMMIGLIEKDRGSITWEGKPLKEAGLKIGYLPEERGLYAKTKVVDQLKYFGELEGMDKKGINKAIDYWFNKFEINEYKSMTAQELSKGNQQKIQLIGTFLHDPELIILDEPFSGLDPVNASMLSHVIEEQIQLGKTVILSSHQMEQIESFCENVCMMKNGEFVVSGKLQQVKDDYGYKNFSFTTEEDVHDLLEPFGHVFEKRGYTYLTQVKTDREALLVLNELAKTSVIIKNFSMIEPTLHQIFVERVK